MAMDAPDQLRQRMAWALAQHFVASAEEIADEFSDAWTQYYDIFVRHAFGNFRDILREVTYSPIMGDFLTYQGNQAYDRSNKFPDENYAREVGLDL